MDLPGPRPQPLGVLPWPAGLLVLPDVPEAADIAREILAGGVPEQWPASLRFYKATSERQ